MFYIIKERKNHPGFTNVLQGRGEIQNTGQENTNIWWK